MIENVNSECAFKMVAVKSDASPVDRSKIFVAPMLHVVRQIEFSFALT